MSLILTPVGGVREIGSNMFAISDGEVGFFIDCGLIFPIENSFDLNFLYPDFTQFDFNIYKNLLITHGHEDHIGAVKYFHQENPNAEIYATTFTKKLLQKKIGHQKINDLTEEIQIGDFLIHTVHVNHSIPETKGLIITHKKYNLSLTYISDFKIDYNSDFETQIDFIKIKEIQKKFKFNLGFIDSTNILVPKTYCSEKQVIEGIETILNKNYKRYFITLFSSNIHRVAAIIKLSKKLNKKIFFSGRSINNYLSAGIESNVLDSNLKITDIDDVRGELDSGVVLLTGCQGDFLGALRRFSSNEHSKAKPKNTDCIIFSSKPIPGNEKNISKITNDLVDFGVTVFNTSNTSYIHSSGHPSKEELSDFYNKLNFTHVIPIHGESFYLKEHYEFIQDNFKKIIPLSIRNFDQIKISKDLKIDIKNFPQKDLKFVLNNGLVVEKKVITERRKVSTRGLILVSYNHKNRKIIIEQIGCPLNEEQVEEIKLFCLTTFSSVSLSDEEDLRLILLKLLKSKYSINPIIKIAIL